MSTQKNCFYRVAALTISGGILSGCGSGSDQFGGFNRWQSSKSPKREPTAEAIQPGIVNDPSWKSGPVLSIDHAIDSVPNEEIFNEMMQMPSTEFFDSIEIYRADAPIQIRGYTFETLPNQFDLLGRYIAHFIADYQTLGDFFQANGISSAADFSTAGLDEGLEILAVAADTGLATWLEERDQSPRQSEVDRSAEITIKFALDDSLAKCVGSALAAAGGAIVTAGSCATGNAPGCVGSGMVTAGAATLAGVNCKGQGLCESNNPCSQETADQITDYFSQAP